MAGEEKRGPHVGVHHLVVVLGTRVGEILVVADTGVVDEDVESSPFVFCRGAGLAGGFFLPRVTCDNGGFDTARGYFLGQSVESIASTRGEHKMCPFLRES